MEIWSIVIFTEFAWFSVGEGVCTKAEAGDYTRVTHPSTNTTQRCLTSVIGRELVLSTWYGRRQNISLKWSFLTVVPLCWNLRVRRGRQNCCPGVQVLPISQVLRVHTNQLTVSKSHVWYLEISHRDHPQTWRCWCPSSEMSRFQLVRHH